MITQWHIHELEKKIAALDERVQSLEKQRDELQTKVEMLIEYAHQRSY